MATETRKHTWRFYRVGGFDQVQLDRGEDLLALEQLDQKLWVALSCPVQGLEFDEKTLALIDTDKDGRIRAPDVIAAVKWACSVLKSPDTLIKGADSLPLAAIDTESEEGKTLVASAKRILTNLGKKGTKEISVEDTSDTAKIFAQTKFNGDGVVPVTSSEDEEVQRAIQDVIDCVGSQVDRNGAPGVTQELVDKFFTEAEAFSGWWKQAESEAATVLPLGDATSAAVATFHAVKTKVDDYFARARLVAFDERAAGPLNREAAEYAALAAKELAPTAPEVASFPLARVEANRPLPLDGGINPAWAAAVEKLRAEVIVPLLGDKTAITDAEWSALGGRIAPFDAWQAQKAGVVVEKLGLPRVRALIDGGFKAKIEELIARDKALEPEANAIDSVDKMVRYARDLGTLLNNFVTFRDFYSRKKKAIFQAGTLYLDGRSCELCLRVNDVAAHAAVATLSGTYLAYCECSRQGSAEKMNIVAAFTGGDSDALMVGRNGVFYDRKGRDWDATIVKLVENPISVRQAFWVPYKRVAKLISEQVEKFAAARDKDVQDHAAAKVGDAGKAAEAAPVPAAPAAAVPVPAPVPVPAAVPVAGRAAPAFDIGRSTGVFAAIMLGVGAIGSAVAAIVTGFLALAWWKMPLALGGVLLAISGPSMLIAWLRLRQRNLGPMLDAAGWAVNARARMNIPFGASLTAVAKLPEGAQHSLEDPFEERKAPWVRYTVLAAITAAVVIAWKLGYVTTLIAALSAPPAHVEPAPSASASALPAPK